MRKQFTNHHIFQLCENEQDAICIFTSGSCTKTGEAVMPYGLAKEADGCFVLAKELGAHLYRCGNIPYVWNRQNRAAAYFISFPLKRDWKDPIDTALLLESARLIKELADSYDMQHIYIPGKELNNHAQAIAVLQDVLDDRFIFVQSK